MLQNLRKIYLLKVSFALKYMVHVSMNKLHVDIRIKIGNHMKAAFMSF